jgi:hypothetical protein
MITTPPRNLNLLAGSTLKFEISSSENIEFLIYLKIKHPKVDLFFDDGSHTINQQHTALKKMFLLLM